ncbi:hypothetical protein QO239_09930 [Cupriavidus taiwanensis]|uniref:hypothetical protein n=1 Tax=Cupriavidus taiwanensis TaxID=164546 RepID=UPI002541F9ED|nr:hypothetical protein [Cupriavidus taiwanensis]MDK3022909.1 hypothetical protein [Cupriavidus taiwanensis]
MRFTRYERHNPIDFNARRQAAFARKQARERDRYPLLADHVAAEQHSVDDEIARRTVRADSFEQRMRAFQAGCWRDARRIYFAQPEAVRVVIRTKWAAWVGPTTSTYFAWMVDVQSGNQARRVAACRARDAAARAARPPQPVQEQLAV